jgi:hypothetical protein
MSGMRDTMGNLSTIKRLVRWFPTGWQHRLSLLYYRYRIRHEPEPAEFSVIRPLLDAGATIVDAGANIGIYSVFLVHNQATFFGMTRCASGPQPS